MTLPARIVDLAEALRAEGLAIGTSELLDAFAALEEIQWTDREPFREALAATLAKSPDDRRVFDLVFDRFFFRAVEEQAVARDVREQGDSDGMTGGEQIDLDNLREQALHAIREGTRARCATSRGSRSPRSAAAARARACSASTSSGSAARSTCAPTASRARTAPSRSRATRSAASSSSCGAS